MGRSIIAAVDGSVEATNAARSAATLARMLQKRLVLAFVPPDPQVFPAGDRWRLEIARRAAVAHAGAVLGAVAEEIEATDARKRIAFSGDLYGGVAERLAGLAVEEDTDLVVIGTRGRGALSHLARRSISAAVIESCTTPVMVVPAGAELDGGFSAQTGVLCGVDGSPGSERARLVARELAGALGVEMHPVFVDQLGGFGDAPDGLWVGVASVARQLIRLWGVPVVVVSPDAAVPRLADVPAQAAVAA